MYQKHNILHSKEQIVRWLICDLESAGYMQECVCAGYVLIFWVCGYQGVVGKDVSQPAYHDSLPSHMNGQSCR